MKWKRGASTRNVEDRRADPGGGGGSGLEDLLGGVLGGASGGSGRGGGFPFPTRRGGGATGSGMPFPMKAGLPMVLLLAVAAFGGKACLGGDGSGGGFGTIFPSSGFDAEAPSGEAASGELPEGTPDPDAKLKDFTVFVFNDVQDMWADYFQQAGERYQETTLVLFRDATQSGCGPASAATGPFYCPGDNRVYIDLGFFRLLATDFDASGDFAQAYVVAHEVGHHVQTITGINESVRQEQSNDPDAANELSVRMELQADCLAGMWAKTVYADGALQDGDIDEALNAAAGVGDDRIQERVNGRSDPESFTHGTSEQRQRWFRTGYRSGEFRACDTFGVDEL